MTLITGGPTPLGIINFPVDTATGMFTDLSEPVHTISQPTPTCTINFPVDRAVGMCTGISEPMHTMSILNISLVKWLT